MKSVNYGEKPLRNGFLLQKIKNNVINCNNYCVFDNFNKMIFKLNRMRTKFKMLLLAGFLLTTKIFGQTYYFKQEYLPNSEYEMEVSKDVESETSMLFNGKSDNIKSYSMQKTMGMKFLFITNEEKNGKIPFTMKISDLGTEIEVEGKGKKRYKDNLLSDLEMNAEIIDDNKIHFDNVEDKVKQEVIKIILAEISQHSVDFPKEGMSLGDSFSVKIPYNVPSTTGRSLSLDIKIYYTLTKVEKNKAFFDTKTNMVMKTEQKEKMGMEVMASGTGVSEFDTEINQFSKIDMVN